MEGLSYWKLGCFLATMDVYGIGHMITSYLWPKPPEAMQKPHQKVAIFCNEEISARLLAISTIKVCVACSMTQHPAQQILVDYS